MSQPQLYNQRSRTYTISSIFIMIILTLMMWEWLKPLLELTDTYTIQPFILYFALGLLLLWLRISPWLRVGIMSVFLLYFIHNLYIYDPFFSLDWLKFLASEALYSLRLILKGDLASHSNLVLTAVFLFLIWMASIVIYKLVLVKDKALYFFVVTAVFLAILDTFSPYSSVFPIIRIFIYGFSLLTFKHILRLSPFVKEQNPFSKDSYPVQWVIASAFMIVLVTWIGMFSPKAPPSWPDPIGFLQGYSNTVGENGIGFGGGAIQRIGYGTNDERLGGPFIMDDGLVFTTTTQGIGYWRGESKDIYTGKGWVQSEKEAESQVMVPMSGGGFNATDLLIHLYELDRGKLNTKAVTTDIVFEDQQDFPIVFYSGDPQELTVLPVESTANILEINRHSASLKVLSEEGAPSLLHGYTIESELPTFSTLALLEANMADVPADILEQYTQLPDTLPDRVGELALTITEPAETTYEKVKRIERYFRFNGYEYNIEQTAVPGEDQDYVDQFLFETMLGYCDNFSSAMTVLLRTLDIPARWVKGFTFGDITESVDGTYTTEVRNKNAHSWVEVYFPEIGWVPFEPTQSFYNPFTFERDDFESSSRMEDDMQMDPLDDPFNDLQNEADEASGGSGQQETSPKLFNWLTGKMAWTIGISILVVLLAAVIFYRRNIVLSWAIMRYREAADEKAFFHLYDWLIRYLGHFVQPRLPSQTMREYILELEEKLDITEFKTMTQVFERMRYGKNEDPSQLQKAYQLWRSIIHKLKS